VTLLGKIVGVYKIGFKSAATGAGLKMDVLIIENLVYEKKVDKSYDLKVNIFFLYHKLFKGTLSRDFRPTVCFFILKRYLNFLSGSKSLFRMRIVAMAFDY
jgi:hypothetical protein